MSRWCGECMRLSKHVSLIALVITSAATFLCAQGSQNPWNFPDFTATQVYPSPQYNISTKLYRSGSDVRVEKNAAMTTLYKSASSEVYDLLVYPDGSRQCVLMTPDQAKG